MGRLSLKLVPGSSRDEVVGWLGDSLKVKVKAPPEKGRANKKRRRGRRPKAPPLP